MDNNNETRVRELGSESVAKLLSRYSMPAIIAMTASSLYNLVDSIYIGQGVGAMAISGLAITFPFMNLSTAFGTLVGAGAASLTSILLGEHRYEESRRALSNVVIMNVAIGLVFMIISLLFLNPILYFFGASDQTIFYAREYMQIILYGNVITHLYFGLNGMLRSAGHPKFAMTATILTVTLNTILDPIFIFAFNMGIRGAAIATVISQAVSLVWVLRIFSNRNNVLHLEPLRKLRFDVPIARRSLSIGLAPFLMNIGSCVVVIFLNQQLKNHGGDLAIGAYGIINRLIFICVMIIMGLNQGMQPIVGYNYGAGLYDRVKEAFRRTVRNATYVTSSFFVLAMAVPGLLVAAFTSDPQLSEITVKGLRISVAVFPLVGYQIVASNYFQCLGMVRKAIFLSLTRQFIFLIPFLWLLPVWFDTAGVWWSMPVADLLSTVTAFFMLRKLHKYNL